ncbi:lycopene cyclase [Citricoccus zhacaiensis]|uniref:Lycopene cyclase n=1 Tax=Citricoccus zhacaiensis TaxID=489142 RepID=A0ABQ2LQT9_9MICC|nr:lycopene cyclase domain-containing protein [Citricoccus zhacaiensis]GGO42037.1 lycopene cyclase [Citricoccus zhacaiensis]
MSYIALAGLFLLLPVAVAAYASWRCRLGQRWWAATGLTIAVLVALTVVFDNLMIAADLFRYNEELLTGWRVGLAPIEDLVWPVAAGLLLPAVSALLSRTRRDGSSRDETGWTDTEQQETGREVEA